DAFPISGWTEFIGTTFIIDYSSPSIQPGNIYLFQRVSDGLVTVYDFNSLPVVYTNSAPATPDVPAGSATIDCTTLLQEYDAGEAFDCDGTDTTREWAMNTVDTPPAADWIEFTGDTFDVDWTGAVPGTFYLFQRVSDGDLTSTSLSLPVTVVNTAPVISSFVCTQGPGPHNSDGETIGLGGLSFVNQLDFTFSTSDCDGNDLDKYWIVKTSPVPPDQADPDWQGPLPGNAFSIDTADYLSLAPSRIYIFIGISDGYAFTRRVWTGQLYLWKKVWLTEFADVSDMWAENGCYSGSGTYSWSYDSGSEYLRLDNYSASSTSAVWGEAVTLPSAPTGSVVGWMMSYVNPAIASGLDNLTFSFLDETHCTHVELAPMTGSGCSANSPTLKEFQIGSGLSVWGNDRNVGLIQNGLSGCSDSEFWADWVGIWLKPTS
ncbi:MAG: hypothetical protein ABIC40_03035, partial [bacterium]